MKTKYKYGAYESSSSTSALATFASVWELARFVVYYLKEHDFMTVRKMKK